MQHVPVSTHNRFGPNQYMAQFQFDNGYSASVVSHPKSYGGRDGLFEVALVRDDKLHYPPEFFDGDVGGHLTFAEVASALDRIAALPNPEPRIGYPD